MYIQHDPGARSPAPRPSLLVAGVSGTGRGEAAAPRFLDAVDGGRAPTAGPVLRWCWKPARLMRGVALLAAVGLVLGVGWTAFAWREQAVPAAVDAPSQPVATAAEVAAPARGPARIERLEMSPAQRPVVYSAFAPAAGGAQARLDSPAAVAAAAARGLVRPPTKRRQEAAVAADTVVPAGSAWAPAEAPADPEPPPPAGLQADADAELLQAVMDWDQRHPPALGRAAAPAARASSPP